LTANIHEDDSEVSTAVNEEPAQDPQIAADSQKTIEYLALLELDPSCDFELRDTFPVNNSNEKSYLINIKNISEEEFTYIKEALENNLFFLVSDIISDDEKETRIYQYSNKKNLYVEIVFSYGSKYLDVIFTPIIS